MRPAAVDLLRHVVKQAVAVVRSPDRRCYHLDRGLSRRYCVRCRVAQMPVARPPMSAGFTIAVIEAPDDELADILCLSVAIGVGWVFARVEVAPERVHPHRVRHARDEAGDGAGPVISIRTGVQPVGPVALRADRRKAPFETPFVREARAGVAERGVREGKLGLLVPLLDGPQRRPDERRDEDGHDRRAHKPRHGPLRHSRARELQSCSYLRRIPSNVLSIVHGKNDKKIDL